MISGFENITAPLEASEKELLPTIINVLNGRHGKKSAIKNREICFMLNERIIAGKHLPLLNSGYSITEARLRKLIHFIHCNNLLPLLCSNSQGYYVADTKQEAKEYIEGLRDRIGEIRSVEVAMQKQFNNKYLETKQAELWS